MAFDTDDKNSICGISITRNNKVIMNSGLSGLVFSSNLHHFMSKYAH